MKDLAKLVQAKIEQIGVKEASKLFGVSLGTVSNWGTGKTPPSLYAAQIIADEIEDVLVAPKPTEVVNWDGKKVMILLPVYRSFNAHTHYTLFANYAKYGPEKIGMEIVTRTVIHEGRNLLVHKALKTNIPTFQMFDDDMILPCGNPAIFNGVYGAGVDEARASKVAISRLMESGNDKGIVCGLYFGRHKKGRAQCSLGFESDQENAKLRRLQYSGYKEVRWGATGCMKIERWVFEKMKKAIDGGMFPECKPSNDQMWYGFFNPLRVGVGEDVSFCTRAAQLGIKTYLDTDLVCLHVGDCNFGPTTVQE